MGCSKSTGHANAGLFLGIIGKRPPNWFGMKKTDSCSNHCREFIFNTHEFSVSVIKNIVLKKKII